MFEASLEKLLTLGGLLLRRSNNALSLVTRVYDFLFERFTLVHIFLMRGVVKNGDNVITTLFLGDDATAFQLADLTYSRIEEMRMLAEYPSFQIDPALLPDVEVTALHLPKLLMKKFLDRGFLLLPCLSFNLDLKRPLSEIVGQSSKRRRRDIRKIESNGYSYAICRKDEKQFEYFYQKMYLPYMVKRFGKAAKPRDYQISKMRFQHSGGIIFVKKDDVPVAGILFQVNRNMLCALGYGILDHDGNPADHLSGQAALFSLIKWARSKGLTNLNYGATVPFFKDGVFQYKREWGMSIEEKTDLPFCALRINIKNIGVPYYLQDNPFIFLDNKSIRGVFFLDHEPTAVELNQIFARHLLPKLESLSVITFCQETLPQTEFSDLSHDQGSSVQPLENICSSLRRHGYNVRVFERFV